MTEYIRIDLPAATIFTDKNQMPNGQMAEKRFWSATWSNGSRVSPTSAPGFSEERLVATPHAGQHGCDTPAEVIATAWHPLELPSIRLLKLVKLECPNPTSILLISRVSTATIVPASLSVAPCQE